MQAPETTVKLSVSSKVASGDEHDVLISILPPDGTKRTPADICCVVDVSGSMGTEATLKNASGDVESHGLSLLDIVKHAVKTILSTLQSQDRLALVVYSGSAKIDLPLTCISDLAITKATNIIEKWCPTGSTNIWDGICKGLDVLSGGKDGRLKSLLLLTDGQPTESPTGGEAAAVRRYKDEHKKLPCSISTFGFGYGIKSVLLQELAVVGDGMYVFIPDSSFVGTAFVNCLTNLLVTMGKNATLSLEPSNGAKIVSNGVFGNTHDVTSWGALVNLCSLQYGQSKDVVVRVSVPKGTSGSFLTATLKYETPDSKPFEQEVEITQDTAGNATEIDIQRARLQLVDTLTAALKENNFTQKQSLAKTLVSDLSAKVIDDERYKDLLEDVKGQVTEAFSKQDFYTKWGSHYLLSLVRAHQLQQCNNFKDPGIQHYGGELFKTIRDEVDDIFVKLPPPKPSVRSSRSAAPVSSMATYYNSSAPCFAGECLVQMADGSRKTLTTLRKGERILSSQDKYAEVACVVKTLCEGNKAELVKLEGGLLITPYHPVRVNGKWEFPCNLGAVEERECPAVYSFVLSEEHVMKINEVECVTLGHDFDEDVVRHPYFGSKKVVQDLEKMNGWNVGMIQLRPGCMVKDPETGLVSGFDKPKN